MPAHVLLAVLICAGRRVDGIECSLNHSAIMVSRSATLAVSPSLNFLIQVILQEEARPQGVYTNRYDLGRTSEYPSPKRIK